MNMDVNAALRLRLENGLHRGVHVPIDDAEMVIGSSTESDIVLCDADVAPRHARLRRIDGQITVASEDGEVTCNDAPLDGGGHTAPLSVGDSIRLGTVHLRVVAGEVHADTPGTARPPAKLRAVEAGVERALRRVPGMSGVSLPAIPSVRVPPPVRLAGQAVLISGALAATVAWGVSMFSTRTAQASYAERLTNEVQQVRTWLEERGVTGVRVAADGGAVLVEGMPSDGTHLAGLDRELEGLASPVINRVAERGGMVQRIEGLLANLGAPRVSVRHLHEQTYAAEGFGGSVAAWQRRRKAVTDDLPHVERLVDRDVLTVEDLRGELRARLAARGLADAVVLNTTDAGAVGASGILDKRRLRRWAGIASDFNRRLEAIGAPALDARVHSTEELLGVPLRSVSAGPVPYVTTADGQRYLEGGALPGGYRLASIDTSRLVIVRDGREFIYDLGAAAR